MEIQNNIDKLKYALAYWKKFLDISYQNSNFMAVTEAAEKIAKLSYTINYLVSNGISENEFAK